MNENAIAILGGTGDQGLGLALRFAKAGRPVVIGSRKLDRAVEAAEKVREAVPGADVEGLANEDATTRAPIVILSVPFEHFASTVKGIKQKLADGQIVDSHNGVSRQMLLHRPRSLSSTPPPPIASPRCSSPRRWRQPGCRRRRHARGDGGVPLRG